MKVGILGAGAMGASVIEHLRQCDGVDGIVAQDIRPERVRELRETFGIPAYTEVEKVLDNAEVPLVFVTASNDAHKPLVLQALEAGKAVMCEKPMANTLADARAMVEAAENRGAYLQIGFELRYSKLYTKIKEWVDAGLLGEVVNTHCDYIQSAHKKTSWRTKAEVGGSMFGEKLSHYVDLPRWWIGADVVDVYTACSPNVVPYYGVRDNYHATYRFANDAVSQLTFMVGPATTFTGDHAKNVIDQQLGDGHALRYIVNGTLGAAETNVFTRSIKRWKFGDAPDTFLSTWEEELTWDPADDHLYYHNTFDQTQDIVRRVAAGEPPKTSARDAYETMKLCFAAEESAARNQVVSLAEME
ncbi:MAG: Gfo/Idh/MocA family protein [Armatimonadota bacterium]